MSEESSFYSATMLIGTKTPCDRCKSVEERVVHLKVLRSDGKYHSEGHLCFKCYENKENVLLLEKNKYGKDVFSTCPHCNQQIKVRETSPLDDLYPEVKSQTMESLWCPHCKKKLIEEER